MVSRRAPDLEALLARIAGALRGREIPFMLIGGQAVLLHGEPRLTHDIDITLGVPPDRLPDVLAACQAADLRALPDDIEGFVRTTFVLPAMSNDSGTRIDLIFSTTPYEAQAIGRAVMVRLHGTDVPFATAEDLLLHKLFAGRPRGIEDALGVVRRKGPSIDWAYLERCADQLARMPDRGDLRQQLERLRRESDES